MDIEKIQNSLARNELDGWLLYDFHAINNIAVTMLNMPDEIHRTRRFFYFVPVNGRPQKLVHRIEDKNLDHLPGEKTIYLSWQSLEEGLRHILKGASKIAMEYSPRNSIPYVSLVDAGMVELITSLGKEVVSSANLIQEFEACLTDEQIETHHTAAKLVRQFVLNAFDEIHSRIVKCGEINEHAVQHFLMRRFEEHNLITDHPPIVGVNANAGDPHYTPQEHGSAVICQDNLVLIDLWAKLPKKKAVYADITWMGYTGETIPDEYVKSFSIIANARDAAFDVVDGRFKEGKTVEGWEVDDAARGVIESEGFGDKFIHRTGHSIGEEIHANGANMDNLETHDDRRLLNSTCFSIEPGIYTGTYGIRTEINVLITADGEVKCTGGKPQTEIVKI